MISAVREKEEKMTREALVRSGESELCEEWSCSLKSPRSHDLGHPAPLDLPLCTVSGDVNCSGTITAADILYLGHFVYESGPAPCNPCTSGP